MNIYKLVLMSLIIAVTGCASIMRDPVQDLVINTTPSGMTAIIGDKQCITPCALHNVPRKTKYIEILNKGNKTTHKLNVDTYITFAVFGNWWNLVGPGLYVDLNVTGAGFNLNPVNLHFAEPDIPIIIPTVKYGITLIVVDDSGVPISDAAINYSVFVGDDQIVDIKDGKTDDAGKLHILVDNLHFSSKKLILTYKLVKNGYFTYSRSLDLELNRGVFSGHFTKAINVNVDNKYYAVSDISDKVTFDSTEKEAINNITLIKPTDYINADLLANPDYSDVVYKITMMLDDIVNKAQLTDSSLKLHSINLTHYKKQPYLTMAMNNNLIYNTVKMSRYDMAKNIFDNVIVKSIRPLNKYIASVGNVYGYDINVIGKSNNFVVKDDFKVMNYRYLMPSKSVSKYVEQEISGQKLLDQSVILMDEERVDLLLQ